MLAVYCSPLSVKVSNMLHNIKGSGTTWLVVAGMSGLAAIGWVVHTLRSNRKRHHPEHLSVMEDSTIRRIGITGAAGLIGSILRQRLPQHGDFELVLFTISDGEVDGSIGVDLSDATALEGKFDDLDCVIHLAGDSSANASWESTIKNNQTATYNVLRECVRAKVRKVIFASSNHIMNGYVVDSFDNPESFNLERAPSVKFTEFDDPLPDSLYGVSKLAGEALGKLFSSRHGIDVVCFRIGWVTLEDDPNALQGKRGDYLRSVFLSQRDCVQAFLKAIRTKLPTKFVVLNLTSANTTGIYDLSRIRQMIGYNPLDNSGEFQG